MQRAQARTPDLRQPQCSKVIGPVFPQKVLMIKTQERDKKNEGISVHAGPLLWFKADRSLGKDAHGQNSPDYR